jgi:hypothetical protein
MKWLMSVAVCLLAIGPIGATADTWDVAADFSAVANPNSAWTYGYVQGGVFAAYGTPETAGDGAGNSFAGWHGSDWDVVGNVGKNVGPNVITAWGSYREVGQVCFGTAYNADLAAVVWTAPAAMEIQVAARFSGQGPDGATVRAYVVNNGTTVFTQDVLGFAGRAVNGYSDAFGTSPVQTYTATLNVLAGQTLLFGVNNLDGFLGGDATGLALTITQVPEPMTLALLAMGAAGCVRRKA